MPTWSLSGSGTQSVSSPGSLAVVITTLPALRRDGQATPTNHYDVGLLRLGTAHGYGHAIPIDATNQVIACPSGVISVGYTLLRGAAVTVEERPETLGQGTAATVSIPQPLILSPYVEQSLGVQLSALSASVITSGAYVTINRAVYYPFVISGPFTVVNAFIVNGGVVSGHFDIGIYDASLARIASTGSTSQSGITSVQGVALSASLSAGTYWLGLALDNTTAQVYNRAFPIAGLSSVGAMKHELSAFPLPNPAVFAATPPPANVYAFGISQVALP